MAGVGPLYAEDAVRMPPNAVAYEGRKGVEDDLQARHDQGVAQIELAVGGAESQSDLGWGYGIYELPDADGKVLDSGKWMNVSRKIKGKWLIVRDIWNSNLPLEQ